MFEALGYAMILILFLAVMIPLVGLFIDYGRKNKELDRQKALRDAKNSP